MSKSAVKPGYFSNKLPPNFVDGSLLSLTSLAESMSRIVFVAVTMHEVEINYISRNDTS